MTKTTKLDQIERKAGAPRVPRVHVNWNVPGRQDPPVPKNVDEVITWFGASVRIWTKVRYRLQVRDTTNEHGTD